MKNLLLIFLLTSFVVTLGFSHGDLHKRIVKASKSIAADPDNEELYFHRGKLYYQHEEFNKGITDLQTAIEKGYNGEEANLFLSKSYFALEDYDKAEAEIQVFFTKNPDHVVAHNLLGKILFEKKNFTKSATEFEHVIEKSSKPLPENYVNAAQSWNALQSEIGLQKAVSILQKGLSDQGPLISLQQYLIKILLGAEQYDQAIEIQESIISSQNRKETAYYTLYEIAIEKGDKCLAQDALENAENAWTQLPKRIKSNSAMIQLYADIEANLKQLTTSNTK